MKNFALKGRVLDFSAVQDLTVRSFECALGFTALAVNKKLLFDTNWSSRHEMDLELQDCKQILLGVRI
jgi:hypothetical protein